MRNIINISLAIFFWSVLHSWLASNKAKSLGQRLLGEVVSKHYRLIYNIFSIISFLPIIGIMSLLNDQRIYFVTKPWVFLILFIQLIAMVIIYYSIKQTGVMDFIGWNFGYRKAYNSEKTLQTDGMYGVVRHPAYFAGLVILWISPIMTVNYLTFCVCISLYLLIGTFFEERKLLREFGEAYQLYKKKVPMLIPGTKWNNCRSITSK